MNIQTLIEAEKRTYSVAVVGGGIAGYTAALALKNLRTDCIWLGRKPFGDKLLLAEYVRNFPALVGDGNVFAARLEEQADREGLLFTEARIDGIYAGDGEFVLTENGETLSARAVILATGVEAAGSCKGEADFVGRGVSYCAVCDGALYRGKTIACVLSSKEFEEEAEYLAGFAATVYAFCLYKEPVFKAPNIRIAEGVPTAVEGGLRVQALLAGGKRYEVDGVFFLKNSAPPSALVGGLKTENGAVLVDRRMAANLPGLFAAGDVTGRPYQYVKAAGEGLVAAYSASEYVRTLADKKI